MNSWGITWMFARSFAVRCINDSRISNVIKGYEAATNFKEQNLAPGAPLISSRSFRHLCSLRCDLSEGCNFRPEHVKSGDCIFISILSSHGNLLGCRNFQAFNTIRPFITKKYILISHVTPTSISDNVSFSFLLYDMKCVNNFESWLESDLLVAWYSPHFDIDRLYVNRTVSVPLAFHATLSYFANEGLFGHCARNKDNGKYPLMIGPGSAHIQGDLSSVQVSSWPATATLPLLSNSVCEHQFVVCSSLICVWEVLMLEGFPLFRADHDVVELQSLPALRVKEWGDVSVQMLHHHFMEFMGRNDWSIDKLFFPFWEDAVYSERLSIG
jgi:hypothetical protein